MPTIHVEPKLHAKLRALSESECRSISVVIEDVVDDYEKAKFW